MWQDGQLTTGLPHRFCMFLIIIVSPLHVCVCVSLTPPHSFASVLYIFCVTVTCATPLHLALTPGILTCCWITPEISVFIQYKYHSCLIEKLLFCFENLIYGDFYVLITLGRLVAFLLTEKKQPAT